MSKLSPATLKLVAYAIWLAPLVALIFDVLIADNLKTINNIGTYIKLKLNEMLLREKLMNLSCCGRKPWLKVTQRNIVVMARRMF